MLGDVLLVEVAAFGEGDIADLGEVDLDAHGGTAGARELADFFEVAAVDEGGGVADVGGLLADGLGVGEGELVGGHAGVLVGQRGDGAAPEHDDVGAEFGEAAALAGAEAFAEADEQEQRGDSPGDAEHGEEGAQLVGRDRLVDLVEDVEESAHSFAGIDPGLLT